MYSVDSTLLYLKLLVEGPLDQATESERTPEAPTSRVRSGFLIKAVWRPGPRK